MKICPAGKKIFKKNGNEGRDVLGDSGKRCRACGQGEEHPNRAKNQPDCKIRHRALWEKNTKSNYSIAVHCFFLKKERNNGPKNTCCCCCSVSKNQRIKFVLCFSMTETKPVFDNSCFPRFSRLRIFYVRWCVGVLV